MEETYKDKPVHDSNFTYSYNMTEAIFKEPKNFLEEINSIFKSIGKAFVK